MTDLTTLLARLDRLEAENTTLRTRLSRLEGADGEPARGTLPEASVSRRQLLRRASVGAGSVALAAVVGTTATIGGGRQARAGGPQPPTKFEGDGFTAVLTGTNTESAFPGGTGVLGVSKLKFGVAGDSDSGIGVRGSPRRVMEVSWARSTATAMV